MIRKLSATLLVLALLISILPYAAAAETAPPVSLGAPEHFGVSHYYGTSLCFSFSAPDDLRAYIEKRAADDPENKQTFSVYFQLDYKIDNGSWHHTPSWDSPETVPDMIGSLYFTFVNGKDYYGSESRDITSLFPEDNALIDFYDLGWDYLKSHSITFRTRFAHSFDYGQTYVLSPWSREYKLSANIKADYNNLINNAPSILSAELKAKPDGEPYFDIRVGRLPGDVADLNSMSGGSVRTEVWMRRDEDKDFKYIGYEWAGYDVINIDASDYFSVDGSKQSYDAESYEIKIRYALDLRRYKQSGYADSSSSFDIYSPFSSVISRNMPAWSNASQWAAAELKKADDTGLIPDILRGADLTKPITREEFCELALLLYEKSTGKSPAPAAPNPFTDTKNQKILKAFALGITAGTSPTTFSPQVLINREQCATMLFRTIKAIAPDGNYSIAGVPDFPDQKNISSFAVEGTKFMSKLGIIKGDSKGNFMPKATTTAQQAEGYGMATREAAVLMSVRTYDKVDDIKETPQQTQPSQPVQQTPGTQPAQPSQPSQPTQPAQPSQPSQSAETKAFTNRTYPSKESITGAWVHIQANTFGTLAGTMSKHYYVFYPDGTFMSGMPDNGLYGFDFKERKATADSSDTIPDYGTYTFSNGKGQLVGNNGAKLDITLDSNFKSLNIGNYKGFMFIPWLDGKRLDGAYTTIVPNLDGKITENAITMEPESFLYLKPDGTFEDEKGIFRWQGKNYPNMDELFPTGEERDKLVHPGKGTYEIKDFSLILYYEDGIVTKHKILLDEVEMSEIDYSGTVISPKKIFIRRERARSNLKYYQ